MSNATALHRLVYVSRNIFTGDAAQMQREVGRILEASRRNNACVGVTGSLLFSADCFAQALEGECAAVQEVFERIQCDERHSHTVVLEAGPVKQREFADWSMAYAGRLDVEQARFAAFIGDGSPSGGVAGAGRVLGLLRGVVQRTAPSFV